MTLVGEAILVTREVISWLFFITMMDRHFTLEEKFVPNVVDQMPSMVISVGPH